MVRLQRSRSPRNAFITSIKRSIVVWVRWQPEPDQKLKRPHGYCKEACMAFSASTDPLSLGFSSENAGRATKMTFEACIAAKAEKQRRKNKNSASGRVYAPNTSLYNSTLRKSDIRCTNHFLSVIQVEGSRTVGV